MFLWKPIKINVLTKLVQFFFTNLHKLLWNYKVKNIYLKKKKVKYLELDLKIAIIRFGNESLMVQNTDKKNIHFKFDTGRSCSKICHN